MSILIIVNDKLSEEECIGLDSGYHFGRGVFETILVKDEPLFLEQHCTRMRKGLAKLSIRQVIDENSIKRCIEQYKIRNCVLKIVASEKNIVISTRKSTYFTKDYDRGFCIRLSVLKRNPYSHVTYLKSLNYTDNMLEREQAKQEGYDEVLFLNVHNQIAEGSMSNVFMVREGILYTPEVNCGILDGVVRKWIIENFVVCEGQFSIKDIKEADELFLTNSIMGVMKVNSIKDIKTFSRDQIYQSVKNKFEQYINQFSKKD